MGGFQMKQRWLARIVMSVVPVMGLWACGGDDGGGADDDDDTMVDAAPGTPDAADDVPDASVPMPDANTTPDAGTPPKVNFKKYTVAMGTGPTGAEGAAYVSVADLDKDGKTEIVLSAFGAFQGLNGGDLNIWEMGADLGKWTKTTTLAAAVKYANQTRIDDLDGDGDLDVMVPSGFFICILFDQNGKCGAINWYEQDGATWKKHEIIANAALWYHWAELVDMDGDGINDLVTAGEERPSPINNQGTQQAQLQWFKGTASGDRFEKTPKAIGPGGGSFPRVRDVDGDGDKDIVTGEFFVPGSSFAWFENDGNAAFTKHNIASDVGPTIQLSLADDLYDDGKFRVIGSNHTNTAANANDPESAIYVLTPGADPKQPWEKQKISTGIVSRAGSPMAPQAAPGIFGQGDIDGDGDTDVLVSGDGDDRVFWLEQESPTKWTTHVLDTALGQAGGMQVIDLNGDGKNELLVTSFEKNVLLIYERQ
jgi:hypothetical protein